MRVRDPKISNGVFGVLSGFALLCSGRLVGYTGSRDTMPTIRHPTNADMHYPAQSFHVRCRASCMLVMAHLRLGFAIVAWALRSEMPAPRA